jgi:hypothetical protein
VEQEKIPYKVNFVNALSSAPGGSAFFTISQKHTSLAEAKVVE